MTYGEFKEMALDLLDHQNAEYAQVYAILALAEAILQLKDS